MRCLYAAALLLTAFPTQAAERLMTFAGVVCLSESSIEKLVRATEATNVDFVTALKSITVDLSKPPCVFFMSPAVRLDNAPVFVRTFNVGEKRFNIWRMMVSTLALPSVPEIIFRIPEPGFRYIVIPVDSPKADERGT